MLHRVGGTFILFFGFQSHLVIAIPGFTPSQLIGALGIGSVAIGFAFKDIFQNLLSGVLILLGEPFRIGDAIIVNGMEGVVTYSNSCNILYAHMMVVVSSFLMQLFIPVQLRLTQLTKQRHEFIVGIGYDDDGLKSQANCLRYFK